MDTLSHLILTALLEYYYYPQFTDEKTQYRQLNLSKVHAGSKP